MKYNTLVEEIYPLFKPYSVCNTETLVDKLFKCSIDYVYNHSNMSSFNRETTIYHEGLLSKYIPTWNKSRVTITKSCPDEITIIIGKYLSIDGIKAMTTILDAEQISKDNIKLKYNKKLKFKTMSYSKKVDDLVKAVDKDAYIHKLNDSEFELRVEGYTKSYRFRIRK